VRCVPAVDMHSKKDPAVHIHPIRSDSITLVEWLGFGETPSGGQIESLLDGAWINAKAARPDVTVVNMGMHWLHFMGQGRDLDGFATDSWVNYEDKWLRRVVDEVR